MNLVQARNTRAFSIIELLAAILVLFVLVAFMLPLMTNRNRRPLRIVCLNNLKQIALVSLLWADDHAGHFPTTVSVTNGGTLELVSTGAVYLQFQVFSNYLRTTQPLHCPADKIRTAPVAFTNLTDANLSYFVALDPTTDNPGATILAGDRNLTNAPPRGSRFVSVDNTTRLGWTTNLHNGFGNIAFADGHVVGFVHYRSRYITTNMPDGITNRLAIP